MKKICVFCGSSPGARPDYTQAAIALGRCLAQQQIGLVYGGARVGIMGEIANAVLEAQGEVIGVIPRGLFDKEVAFTELADLRVVETMHERKAMMAKLSDGFIALPGGMGTIEEFFEVLTWGQLDLHQKPCALLNVSGFYDRLLDFLPHGVAENFLVNEDLARVLVDTDPETLIQKMVTYQPPLFDKAAWILQIGQGYRDKHGSRRSQSHDRRGD